MTDEQLKKKQEQQKAKAPPPGTSRILSRATKEQKKKTTQPNITNQLKNNTQTNEKKVEQPNLASPSSSITVKPTYEPANIINPSNPPENIISKNENIQTTQNKKASASPINMNENEEWQNMAEDLNPETNFELCEKIIQDDAFLARLKQRLNQSKMFMLDGNMEGAAMFRDLCKMICNLLSIEIGVQENSITDNQDIVVSSLSKTMKPSENSITSLSSSKNEKTKMIKILTVENVRQCTEKFCLILDLPNLFLDLIKELLFNDKPNFKNIKQVS